MAKKNNNNKKQNNKKQNNKKQNNKKNNKKSKKKAKDDVAVLRNRIKMLKEKRAAKIEGYDINALIKSYNQSRSKKNPGYISPNDQNVLFGWKNLNRSIKQVCKDLEKHGIEIDPDECVSSLPCGSKLSYHKCDNCNRRDESGYGIGICTISSEDIHKSRHFGFLKSTHRGSADRNYTVCSACKDHLCMENAKLANSSQHCWAAFLWSIMSSPDVHEEYRDDPHFIWKLIPREWRVWWIDELLEQFPSFYSDISIDKPDPVFFDRTLEINEFTSGIKSGHLPTIAKVWNKNPTPTILCPWGCSEFIHKGQPLDIQLIFQKHIDRVKVSKVSPEQMSLIDPSRSDFVRDTADCYDRWLFNNEWLVKPSFSFIEGSPYCLTCCDHNGGESLLHLHLCRCEKNISSKHSDQVTHAVMKPRTVKNTQLKYNSISYRMVEQRFSWRGPDTINVSTHGKMDYDSILLDEQEARSYCNRSDMKSLLSDMIEAGIMTKESANDFVNDAEYLSQDIDYEKLKIGATYIPLEIAMDMKKEAKIRRVEVIIDDELDKDGNVKNQYTKWFKRYWPNYIYPCQSMDTHGAKMHHVPRLSGDKSYLCWQTLSMLLSIEPLWNATTKMTFYSSGVYGFLLSFLTNKCLFYLNWKACGAFTVPNKTVLTRKVNQYENICEIMSNIPGVFCHYMPLDSRGENTITQDYISSCVSSISEDDHDLIVISNVLYSENLPYNIETSSNVYELRYCSSLMKYDDGSYDIDAFSRHGNHFSSWWYCFHNDEIQLKSQNSPILKHDHIHTLVYVKKTGIDVLSYKYDLLKLQGGQAHVQCPHHERPLIRSRFERKCSQCNRHKEYLCCGYPSCNVRICKACFNDFESDDVIHYVQVQDESDEFSDSESISNLPELKDRDHYDSDDDESHEESSITDRIFGHVEDASISSEEDYHHRTNDFDDDDGVENLFGYSDPPTFEPDELYEMQDENVDCNIYGIGIPEGDPENDRNDSIPTTNAADVPFQIRQETEYGGPNNEFTISGSGYLSEASNIITRKRYDVRGSRADKYFVQKFCSTVRDKSFSTLYTESAIFKGINYADAPDNISSAGSLVSCLFAGNCRDEGFSEIPKHVRCRLSSPLSCAYSDANYTLYLNDLMCSIACNHCDTRTNKRGLTSSTDNKGGLDLRGKDESSFLYSVDSNKMANNLCASLLYFIWDIFLTYTCNMRKHFGTKPIREWIDQEDWDGLYPGWKYLKPNHQREVKEAIVEAASSLFLRVWEEVSADFVKYLTSSPSSPFKGLKAHFARKEYQASIGNLSHLHFIGKLHVMSEEQREEVMNLIRNNYIDIIHEDEIDVLIQDGYIKNEDEVHVVRNDGLSYLRHYCGARCLVYNNKGELVCRDTNYENSSNPSIHCFDPLPNNLSQPCLERLLKCGMLKEHQRDEKGNIVHYVAEIDYFHPLKHFPPWKKGDYNISPCETRTFCVCKSMQNYQWLAGAGSTCKYCVKYCAKIDKNNTMSVATSKDGSLIVRGSFLHNTKRVTSDIAQQKILEGKRTYKHPKGSITSLNEIRHHIFKYPEVMTDLRFEEIPTTSLSSRAGHSIRNPDISTLSSTTSNTTSTTNNSRNNTTNSENEMSSSSNNNNNNNNNNNVPGNSRDVRNQNTLKDPNDIRKDLTYWRKFTPSQVDTLFDMLYNKKSGKLDKITRFGLRPPELRSIFDMVGKYYRWFEVGIKPIKDEKISEMLKEDIYNSPWIDASKCVVKVRKKALPEIVDWIDSNKYLSDDFPRSTGLRRMAKLFHSLHHVCFVKNRQDLNNEQHNFLEYAEINLLCEYNFEEIKLHLPIPTFSNIKPSMVPQFLLHILLSMGRFVTEKDILLHGSLRNNFQAAKLIGPNVDERSLTSYSNHLMNYFIRKQLQYFPNGKKVADAFMIRIGDLFDSVIIEDVIPVVDMPAVQLSNIIVERSEQYISLMNTLKRDLINAAIREIGEAYKRCNVPSLEDLMDCTSDNPLDWDPVANFSISPGQSRESFMEQVLAIETCVQSIHQYMDPMNTKFTKSVLVVGFPGGGKTFIMMYMMIYAISKGLKVLSVAMMAHRANLLGGWHWHHFLRIPVDKSNNMSVHRMIELAITKLDRFPYQDDIIKGIDIIFDDEAGQRSSNFDDVVDGILRFVCKMNVYKAGKLSIATFDPTQLKPINGLPFMLSSNILPCYKAVQIKQSVRAQSSDFFRIQQIARMSYDELMANKDEYVSEFRRLCEGFTFVDTFDDPKIKTHTFRVYGKNVPAKKANQDFVKLAKQRLCRNDYIESVADDLQKNRFSNLEWEDATDENIKSALDTELKEPSNLLFFRGAVLQVTFNNGEEFRNSQLVIVYDIPSKEDVLLHRKVKVLAFPPTVKISDFDMSSIFLHDKNYFIETLGFTEISVGIPNQERQVFSGNIKGKRVQYGLRNFISDTIHGAMGMTYLSLAVALSAILKEYKLWEKGQLIVLISRTREMSKTIFVGPKSETIDALVSLLLLRSHWDSHMSRIIENITETSSPSVLDLGDFPYRIQDVSLPQDGTGAVYFMVSKHDTSFVIIDRCFCLRTRINCHNHGISSFTNIPEERRPYVLVAYIVGFQNDRELLERVRDDWRNMKCNDFIEWARSAQEFTVDPFGNSNGLQLSLLLRNNT